MSRKRLVIIGLIAAAFTLGAISLAAIQSSTDKPKITPTDDEVGDVTSLSINGLDNPELAFDTSTQNAIKLGIGQYLKADNIDVAKMKGIVREKSYKSEVTADGTISSVLIDIPDAKRTYKASSSG